METARRFFLGLFSVALSALVTILVMINGWGLEAKSWGWIIGMGVFGQIACMVLTQIAIAKK